MSDLTPEQIAEMRSSAETALSGGSQFEFQCLATPVVVLSLLDEIERLRAAMPSDSVIAEVRHAFYVEPGTVESESVVGQWLSRIDAARKGPER